MKPIFEEMWKLAKPYYERGRPYNVFHVQWMLKTLEKYPNMNNTNYDILYPLAILHDTGYAELTNKTPHMKDKNAKVVHMKRSAEIAKEILGKLKYDPKLTEEIIYLISVHDNWCLGDNEPYKKSNELYVLTDLDFLWVTGNFKWFKFLAKTMNLTSKEFYKKWTHDEKLTNRPFCCKETQQIWDEDIEKIRNQLDKE